MRAALTAAGKRRGQEPPGDLHRLVRVEIYVYSVARGLAAKQADVLAIGPVVRYLLFGDPQRFPARAAWVLLAGRDRDHGHAAADEGGGIPTAFLRAHAAPWSGAQSVRAT